MAKQLVAIRLFNNGMRLKLDGSAPFDEILEETARRFREGSSFFKDAALSVTFEGRRLSQDEEDELIDTITDNSSVRIICICKEDLVTDTMFVRAVRRLRGISEITPVDPDISSFKIIRGDVGPGEVIETRENLLVLGSAAEGSVLVSHKSILVMGDLLGQAIAGSETNLSGTGSYAEEERPEHAVSSCMVYAQGFAPEKLRICGLRYRGQLPSQKTLGFHSRLQPRAAFIKNGLLIIDSLEKGLEYV